MRGSRVRRAAALDVARPLPLADTTAEVDATFRTERRIAVGYFVVFVVATLAVPALTLVLDWWSEGRVLGGMSPAFLMTAVGLYVFFFALAVAASSLASTVEDRMLGEPDDAVGPGWGPERELRVQATILWTDRDQP